MRTSSPGVLGCIDRQSRRNSSYSTSFAEDQAARIETVEMIYLERRVPEKNLSRFYRIAVVPTLFGEWSLLREWGRIGSPGTVREAWFGSRDEAVEAALDLLMRKEKKGYIRNARSFPLNLEDR